MHAMHAKLPPSEFVFIGKRSHDVVVVVVDVVDDVGDDVIMVMLLSPGPAVGDRYRA